LDIKTKGDKDTIIIDRLVKRMERVGITKFIGIYDMVQDYVKIKNQEVSDSKPPSNVIKIVEIIKHNPQLWQYDLNTIIKTVVKYFSNKEEIEYSKEIKEILEVIVFI
jgi:hypothetical protein